MITDEKMRAAITKISQELADNGKLVEAGWQACRILTCDAQTPAAELDKLREVFFSGAQHLWGSIFSFLDPGTEETEDDMRRMDQLNAELGTFAEFLAGKYGVHLRRPQ